MYFRKDGNTQFSRAEGNKSYQFFFSNVVLFVSNAHDNSVITHFFHYVAVHNIAK